MGIEPFLVASTVEGVLSTATHFMLRSYKEHGFLLEQIE